MQFWCIKRLYINIREYYGDIVLASKVDSLNIVSNTKPLSLENKSVDNSKIELFTTNSIKANVDEVNISNQNNSEEFEEKADNNKKWLIGAGIALGAVALGVATTYILRKKLNVNSLKKEILKLDLNGSIKPEQLLGEGGEGAVYRIANSNYVLKVPHKEQGIKGTKVDLSKLDLNITPQERINHIVAKCGDATIMKYIEGINSRKAPANLIENLSSTNIKTFFLDILTANKKGMKLDYSGANCIINPKTGKLTPIDFWPGQDKHLLSAFMAQTSTLRLTATEQNKLLQKGTINLLELIRDSKIDIKDCQFIFKGDGFATLKDKKFLEQIEKLVQQYNSSEIDILTCLKNLRTLNPIVKIQVPNEITQEIKNLELAISKCTDSLEKSKLQKSLEFLNQHIQFYYT